MDSEAQLFAGQPGGGRAAMPLAQASVGQEVKLARVEAGRQLQMRLAEMGLMPGARFRIVNSGRPGPFIISLRGARLVLGHGMVVKMFVFPV